MGRRHGLHPGLLAEGQVLRESAPVGVHVFSACPRFASSSNQNLALGSFATLG
jgi:hypothetical protein